MRTLTGKRCLLQSLAALMLSATFAGCSLMHDDLADCAVRPPTHTSVKFVYDYNTRTSDMFNDHVGAVTLYVFDSDGKLVERQEQSNASTAGALKSRAYQIDLNLQPGDYKVYAVARAHHAGYQGTLEAPGAKFRRTELAAGDHVDNYLLTLDNNAGSVDNRGVMIDTLWTTLAPQTLRVPLVEDPKEGDPQQPDVYVSATVPLMRVTNRLHISFFQEDFPSSINPADYDVWIETSTGRDRMDILGNMTAEAIPLTYTPFAKQAATDDAGHACVSADFGMSRLIYDESASSRARLYIKNKNTQHVTVIDHIAELLAKGRDAYAPNNWSEQEYLDREYDYDLAICLKDKVWKYAIVRVNILSWSKRIQNENL